MKRVALDEAPVSVREFVRSLPLDAGGVQLELGGQVICTIVPANDTRQREAATILERGRELVRLSRERAKGLPSATIEREVRQAVNEVRRRTSR